MVTESSSEIDEAMIERVVRAFYDVAKVDPLIGPVFASKVHDWEPHLQQMFAFWSSIMLGSGRYRGRPMAKHFPLAIDGSHFARWLTIFAATAREVCPREAAERFIEQANRIGIGLQHGLALQRESEHNPAFEVVQ